MWNAIFLGSLFDFQPQSMVIELWLTKAFLLKEWIFLVLLGIVFAKSMTKHAIIWLRCRDHLIKMPHIPKLLAFIDVNVYCQCFQCFYGHCLLLLIFIVNVYCRQGYAMWRWAMHASVTTATDNTITDYIVISLIGIPCLTNY